MASSVVLPFYGLSSTFFPAFFPPRPFSVFSAFSMLYGRNPLGTNGFSPSLFTGKPHYLPLYAAGVPLLEISLGAIPHGFESHPLRQKAIRFCEWLFSCRKNGAVLRLHRFPSFSLSEEPACPPSFPAFTAALLPAPGDRRKIHRSHPRSEQSAPLPNRRNMFRPHGG